LPAVFQRVPVEVFVWANAPAAVDKRMMAKSKVFKPGKFSITLRVSLNLSSFSVVEVALLAAFFIDDSLKIHYHAVDRANSCQDQIRFI